MKKKVLVGGILGVSIFLAACGGGSGTSKETTAASTAAETTVAASETTLAAETTPETSATEAATPEETTAEESASALNETVNLKDWAITVTNFQILDSISESQYSAFKPEEGNKYIFVTASVSNNGKSAETFMPSFGLNDSVSAKVLYGDGYEFSLTNLLGYSKNLIDTHVNPLSTKEGDLAFEIPDSVASSEDALLLEFSAGNEKVIYKLR